MHLLKVAFKGFLLFFLFLYRRNPVGRPRKKGKKERKMNVDFSNDQFVTSQEIHPGIPPSPRHLDATPPPPFPTPEAMNAHGNMEIVDNVSGNVAPNERLMMPKRPHNVIHFTFCLFYEFIISCWIRLFNENRNNKIICKVLLQ